MVDIQNTEQPQFEASQESQKLPEAETVDDDGGKAQSEPKSVVSSSGDVDDSQDLIDIETINCETLLDDDDQPSGANLILGNEDDMLLPIKADNSHVSPLVDLGTSGDGIISEQATVTVIQSNSSGEGHTDDSM